MTDPLCGIHTVWGTRQYLPLVNVKAHTTILASTSRTQLTQTFVNGNTIKLREVQYVFPLFDGVSVVAFTCHIGGRTIVGQVKEREKAKQDFKEAAASGQQAGLFEQAREVSDCFITTLANIPAGAKVEVNITYIGELKHDAEVDGTRFTIPALIVPRYGDYPVSLASGSTQLADGRMEITVDVVLPRQNSIQRIQSPSHPISINLGTTSVAPDADPVLSKASATLALSSVGIDKDFILQVVAKNTGVPTAVLETHPTIPNHRAVMATLVPRFSLPPEHPEVVFVVDRSGSMSGQPMELVKSALKVFLKSIPVGVKFNICSFGSSYAFLWQKSQAYNEATLDEALKYVLAMSANFGGTEMLQPLTATIQNRYKDLPLEILLLTDGEIWDQKRLFNYLNQQVAEAKSPLRLFTLGVGSGVSHALIEGVARAGNGFSQAVSDGEKMDSKLVRMLKGAMSPHITDYTLEIKYDQTTSSAADDDMEYELIDRVVECLKIDTSNEKEPTKKDRDEPNKKPISFFDTTVDLDKDYTQEPKESDTTGESRYAHLPAMRPPKLLQAPHVIPPLYAFNRTTVYLLLSPDCSQLTPTSVILRGKSTHGPLELEIPIGVLDDPGELVHQLAAKKAVAELEQGRGWIKQARDRKSDTLLSELYESRFDELIEREAVRLGVQFQIAGKWTSFVALEEKKKRKDKKEDKKEDKKGGNKAKEEDEEETQKQDRNEAGDKDKDRPAADASDDDEGYDYDTEEKDDELEHEEAEKTVSESVGGSPPTYQSLGGVKHGAFVQVQVTNSQPPVGRKTSWLRKIASGMNDAGSPAGSPSGNLFGGGGARGIPMFSNIKASIGSFSGGSAKMTTMSLVNAPVNNDPNVGSSNPGSFGSPASSPWGEAPISQPHFPPVANSQSPFLVGPAKSPSAVAAPVFGSVSHTQTLSTPSPPKYSSTYSSFGTTATSITPTSSGFGSSATSITTGYCPPPLFGSPARPEQPSAYSSGGASTSTCPPYSSPASQSTGFGTTSYAPSSGFGFGSTGFGSITPAAPLSGSIGQQLCAIPPPPPPPSSASLAFHPSSGFGSTSSGFGSTSSGSLFGSAAPTGGFGSAAPSTVAPAPPPPPPPPLGGSFGSPAPPLFGSAPLPASSPSTKPLGSVFGSPAPTFGSAAPVFGSVNPAAGESLGSAAPTFGSTAPVFGSANPTAGGLFGSATPIFGSATPAMRGSFGSPAPDIDTASATPSGSSSDGLGGGGVGAALPAATSRPPLETLIELQTFAGFWETSATLVAVLGLAADKIQEEVAVGALDGVEDNKDIALRLLATALAVKYFEVKLKKDKDTWELVVDKAKGWLLQQLGGDEDKLDKLLDKAAVLLP